MKQNIKMDIKVVHKRPRRFSVDFGDDERAGRSVEITNETQKNERESFEKAEPEIISKQSYLKPVSSFSDQEKNFFAKAISAGNLFGRHFLLKAKMFKKNSREIFSVWKEINSRVTVRVGWAVVIMTALVFVNVFRANGSSEVVKLGNGETKAVATSGVSVISESPKVSVSSQEERIVELEEGNFTLKDRLDKLSSQMKYYPVSNPEDERQSDDISDLQNSMELLSGQVKALTEQNSGIIDFALAIDYKNLIYKNKSGNLDLEDGKLKAQEISVNELSVKNDGKNRAVGQGNISPMKQDGNLDGFDDSTLSDGKSVKIETGLVAENSHIFVTPRSGTAFSGTLTVTETRTGEYFKVSVPEPVSEDIPFDWLVVNEDK